MSARCMLSSFVSRGFTKSWVGQVALRSPINRHALDLTVSLDDQGQLERVSLMGPWSPLFDLHLPRLRFPPYGFLATGSPRLTAFLAPLSPAKLPVSYPFFLSSPCTNFDPTDFCHLRRRSNLLICLFAIFGLNDYVVLFCFNSVVQMRIMICCL